MPRALPGFAGPRALVHLRERGLKPADVRVIPAAAGGPKGLILNPLDRYVFGHWLAGSAHTVHLLGGSIGAWRMACARLPDADAALAALAQGYVHQQFNLPAGQWPKAAEVSRVCALLLQGQFGGQEATQRAHPRCRLHIFTSRGRGPLLHLGAPWATPLVYAAAFASDLVRRRALGGWLQRVVFSDPRDALPLALGDFATQLVALAADNLAPAILASGSIPFVLQPVHPIAGAPRGAYWDGGSTDYHLHLPCAGMADGLVLYPHLQRALVPGWLDKGLKRRHGATGFLDNVVVMARHPDGVRRLPGGKLPDRQDFKAWRHEPAGRIAAWTQAIAAAGQMADEAAAWLAQAVIDALPL